METGRARQEERLFLLTHLGGRREVGGGREVSRRKGRGGKRKERRKVVLSLQLTLLDIHVH